MSHGDHTYQFTEPPEVATLRARIFHDPHVPARAAGRVIADLARRGDMAGVKIASVELGRIMQALDPGRAERMRAMHAMNEWQRQHNGSGSKAAEEAAIEYYRRLQRQSWPASRRTGSGGYSGGF